MKAPSAESPLRAAASAAAMLGTVLLALGGAGCLGHDFPKGDPQPATTPFTQQVLDQVAAARLARKLPPASVVPELRPPALKGMVAVARGDQSLATAAHAAGLRTVQEMGRHTWTFATDCGDLARLQLPPLVVESRELMMNAAAVPAGDHTFVMIIVTESGASSIRAEQMGGGGGGTNPSIESYVHPLVAPGRCGDRWPASKHSES